MKAFDCRSDGTAHFDFGEGGQITLRRPKLKQYRRLIEDLTRMRKDLLPDSDPGADEEAALAGIDPAKQFDALIGWYGEVFETLGDGPLPGDDYLESWIFNPTIPRDLIQLWTEIPTDRGAR